MDYKDYYVVTFKRKLVINISVKYKLSGVCSIVLTSLTPGSACRHQITGGLKNIE